MRQEMRTFMIKKILRRQGRLFEQLEEFKRTQFYAESELKAYQESKLKNLISHAYHSVPAYKELFDSRKLIPDDIRTIEDIEKLPIIDKEFIRRNYSKLLSTTGCGSVFTRRTGGSTGVPLRIVNTRESSITESALYYRYLQWMGYSWGDSIWLFWGEPVQETSFRKYKVGISRKLFNTKYFSTLQVNETLLQKILSDFQHSRPKVLRGYTSALYLLASHFVKTGLQFQGTAISPTAEKLYDFQRHEIEKAFGRNVFNQYGCGETNSIAFECEKHAGMHVASEHVLLEIMDGRGKKSNRGNIIITNLDSYAMPIIRYKNEDVASWAMKKCECGRTLPLLSEIEGRVTEFIQGPNGKKVHGSLFNRIFGGMKLADNYSIREFRVVQEKIDKLRIEFVTEQDISPKDRNFIETEINRYLGDVEIEIRKVAGIPLTRLGKKIYILSLLNRDKWQVEKSAAN